MRGRWQALMLLAGLGLFGLVAGWFLHGMHLDKWLLIAACGLGVAFGLALWATATAYRQRWPAAVALVCVAPVAAQIVDVIIRFPSVFAAIDVSGIVFIIGSMGTVVAAFAILWMKPAPPPPDPIAPARIARRLR
jgi:hypothetical protein